MRFKYDTAAQLSSILEEEKITLPAYALARDSFYLGKAELELRAEIERRMQATRNALNRGFREPQTSVSGMTRGAAAALAGAERLPVKDELWNRALAYALAVNEVNACGGRIVAFPTAGSCGIVPGVLWAWRDEREPDLDAGSPRLQDAFVVAASIGALIAMRATLAGAAGGCQAECGAAGAMAAGALAWLISGEADRVFNAAALSLKNSLGLACDPIAGLVEVPCVKRNAFLAANALCAATLDAAGVRSVVPFDEVVSAMKSIGDAMPASIRESAEGGLAVTPTGCRVRDEMMGMKD